MRRSKLEAGLGVSGILIITSLASLIGCEASSREGNIAPTYSPRYTTTQAAVVRAMTRPTPDKGEILAAEAAFTTIETARLAGDWNTVNKYLSGHGFSAERRNLKPAAPFAGLEAKAGHLTSFELLISMGGAPYFGKDGSGPYRRVTIFARDRYAGSAIPTVNLEVSMLDEGGDWKLAGLTAVAP